MPSSLYNSVKQSVAEYSQIKKKNERVEERLLFKWKLITIVLAILFIVLVGLFSQFLKDINNLPDVQGDKTYIVDLLFSANQQTVNTIGHASNLVRSISETASRNNQHFELNLAQKIYSVQTNIVYGDLLTAITNRHRLLFLFSYSYNATYTARFGLYAHRGYSGQQSSSGITTVKDEAESKWSSMFNLNNEELMLFNNANCFLFENNGTALTILEGLTTTSQGAESGMVLQTAKAECYHQSTQTTAFARLKQLTGIQSQDTSERVLGMALDVFALGLNEDA